MAAQLRMLRTYAERHGHVVAREYVDEAEGSRMADRPQFRQVIDEGSRYNAPFQETLVWKFSRFTRKREHAVAAIVELLTEHGSNLAYPDSSGTKGSRHGAMRELRVSAAEDPTGSSTPSNPGERPSCS